MTLGLAAIGIADRNSFAGVVRAYDEAQKRNIKLLVGTRLVTVDGFEVLAYPTDRAAYGRLCRLITAGNLQAKKGECSLSLRANSQRRRRPDFHRAAATILIRSSPRKRGPSSGFPLTRE